MCVIANCLIGLWAVKWALSNYIIIISCSISIIIDGGVSSK
jgi:hypothetical protein